MLDEACGQYAPGRPPAELIPELLRDHPTTPEGIYAEALAQIDEATAFTYAHDLLPELGGECKVGPAPPARRWAIAMMSWAAPYEADAPSWYYVTPPDPDWPDEEQEEWLAVFSRTTLPAITVHEVTPGHFAHGRMSRRLTSDVRRCLMSPAFVEGWAHYTEELFVEEGFRADDPRYAIGVAIEALIRVTRLASAIGLHSGSMTLAEATRRFETDSFHQGPAARAEAERAMYDPTYGRYTWGKLEILKLREQRQTRVGRRLHPAPVPRGDARPRRPIARSAPQRLVEQNTCSRNRCSLTLRGMQRSFEDLGTPLHEVTFAVVDLETTGGSPATCAITEVGAIKFRGGECLGTFQTLINPGVPIPPEIVYLTGITQAMVGPAPKIGAVLPAFLDFVGDAVVVGHNVRFDISFLQAALAANGWSRLTNRSVDTCALARRLVRDEVRNCKLSTLADHFRLARKPTHRALDDAVATGELLHVLLERSGPLGVTGLDDLLALPTVKGHPQLAKLKLTLGLPAHPACICSATAPVGCSTSGEQSTCVAGCGRTSPATGAARFPLCCARCIASTTSSALVSWKQPCSKCA